MPGIGVGLVGQRGGKQSVVDAGDQHGGAKSAVGDPIAFLSPTPRCPVEGPRVLGYVGPAPQPTWAGLDTGLLQDRLVTIREHRLVGMGSNSSAVSADCTNEPSSRTPSTSTSRSVPLNQPTATTPLSVQLILVGHPTHLPRAASQTSPALQLGQRQSLSSSGTSPTQAGPSRTRHPPRYKIGGVVHLASVGSDLGDTHR
jgi:hypothetical protein